MPKVENLDITKWSSVILVDDQMQVHNLFIDRFCLRPLAIWRANSQKQFTQARLRNQLIYPPTKVKHNCLAEITNNCLVKLRTIENGYAKDQSCKQTKLQIID